MAQPRIRKYQIRRYYFKEGGYVAVKATSWGEAYRIASTIPPQGIVYARKGSNEAKGRPWLQFASLEAAEEYLRR